MTNSESQTRQFALASNRVVFPNGVCPGIVVVVGEQIANVILTDAYSSSDKSAHEARLRELSVLPKDCSLEFLDDLVLAPGLIDTHVHINEPGNTEWEGFVTATQAAAAGGVTTLMDMPLNSVPVTTDETALKIKREVANGKCWVDVGFYGGLVSGKTDSLSALLDAGVFGIKAFLCHSGLNEFPNAKLVDLKTAAPHLQRFGRPLLVHAELTDDLAPRPTATRRYREYLQSRPPRWEAAAVELLIDFCRDSGCRIHIVHLANADLLPALGNAKSDGLPITVETCPHYLHFSPDDVADGATQFKCAPPIREVEHRERLWDALQNGMIDTIGSDHSPCPPELKQPATGDFMSAWGGIASVQLTLPVMWAEAHRRGVGLEKLFRWLSTNPSRLVGLTGRKGEISVGNDADLVAWDPDSIWKVSGQRLRHRHKVTPYDGAEVRGEIRRTYLRGQLVYADGALAERPSGQLLSASSNRLK